MANKKFDPTSLLPQEVFDQIADHLSEKDVLNCILVSRSWYGAVIRSKSAMNKLTIKYNKKSQKRYLNLLLESDRPYQNIYFDIRGIESQQRNCADINFRTILSTLASSIDSINTNYDLNGIFDIPRLKSLTIRGETVKREDRVTIDPDGLMSKAKNVEKLAVKNSYGFDSRSSGVIRNALRMMEKLKVLDVDSSFDFWPIKNHVSSLRAFKYRRHDRPSSVFDYLLTHQETLTFIELDSISQREMTAILAEFPKLRILYIGFYSWFPTEKNNLPLNETITKLKLYTYHGQSPRFLIQRLKNLEILLTPYLEESLLEFILVSSTIRQVSYRSIYGIPKRSKLKMINSPIKFIENK